MARAKVIGSKKQSKASETDLLKQPDEVITTLHRFSDHLSRHFKTYVVGLAAFILVVLAIQLLISWRRGASVERAAAFQEAVGVMLAPVDAYAEEEDLSAAPDPEKKLKGDFATDQERWTAALDKVKAAREGASGPLATIAALAEGRVNLALGDNDAAAAAFQKFLDDEKDSSLGPIVLENRGRAAEAAGKLSEAATYYEKIAGLKDLYYQVHGQMLLGDLYNPGMGKGDGKDAAKARGYYDAALQALTPAEGQVLGASLRSLRTELKRRSAQLQG